MVVEGVTLAGIWAVLLPWIIHVSHCVQQQPFEGFWIIYVIIYCLPSQAY